jgi:hypothetical protein
MQPTSILRPEVPSARPGRNSVTTLPESSRAWVSCLPTRTGRLGVSVRSWDQQVVRRQTPPSPVGRTGRGHGYVPCSGTMAGQVARLAARVAPPLLSLGRRGGPSAVRDGLVRVGGGAGGRCLGALALRRPSPPLGPRLTPPTGGRGRPAAQPLSSWWFLQ